MDPMTIAALVSAGSSAYGAIKGSKKGKSKGGGISDIKIPDFYTDPNYTESQDLLSTTGSNLLAGKPGDYYKSIGETGGGAFENMMKLIGRDTSKAVSENLVRRNVARGGLGASLVAKSMSDVGTKLRWEDYSRAQKGKQFLLGKGLDTTEGVRSSALNFGSQKNLYNLNATKMAMGKAEAEEAASAREGSMWSSILSSGIGSLANIYGMKQLGGIIKGSAAGSSGTVKSPIDYSSLNKTFNISKKSTVPKGPIGY